METQAVPGSTGIFRDRMLNSIAMSHFIVDILNGQRSLLFAYLSVLLGLSNYGLGMMTSAYVISSALAQPIFGYVADRFGARWVAAGGVLWMGTFFSLAMLFPGWTALGFLVLASISSGAFHPAGAMEATMAGRHRLNGREATSSSYFFLFGQLGGGIGPMLGGPLLSLWGMPGLLLLAVFTIPVGTFAARELRFLPLPSNQTEKKSSGKLVISGALLLMIGISAFKPGLRPILLRICRDI